MDKQLYQKQIVREVKQYRKAIDKLDASKDPRYRDRAFYDEAVKERREELEKKVAEIKGEFDAQIDAAIEEQSKIAARSTFRPTSTEKQLAEEFVSDLKASLTFAISEQEKQAAFDKFEQRLDQFDEGGLYEVKKRLPDVMQVVKSGDRTSASKLRAIHRTFDALQTEEQYELDELKNAKASGVDYAHKRLTLTHKTYADKPRNMHHGGSNGGVI